MSKKIRTEAVDYLFDAVLSLENKEECYIFLKIFVQLTSSFLYPSDLKLPKC